MSRILYSKETIQFVYDNYPKFGPDYCAENLNLTKKQISSIAHHRKIVLSEAFRDEQMRIRIESGELTRPKPLDQYAVNPEQFFNISSKEAAYILGLLWADGYIYNKRISIECVEDDLITLLPIFLKTGKWSFHKRERKNRRPQLTICTHNVYIFNFLLDNFYGPNSTKSACQILSLIPKELHPFWFRGVIDGDGGFYVNTKNHCYQFGISARYDQDWSFMENLFKELEVKYSLKRQVTDKGNKLHQHSVVRVTNISDIEKIHDYIYATFPDDKIGLLRKYEKCLFIKQRVITRSKRRGLYIYHDGQ